MAVQDYVPTLGAVPFTMDMLLASAVRRCGAETGGLPQEVVDGLRRLACSWLSALSTRGIQLWTVEQTILGIVPRQVRYKLPVGTVDVQRVMYRTLTLTPTLPSNALGDPSAVLPELVFDQDYETTTTGVWFGYDFAAPALVTTVSLMPAGDCYLSLVVEASNDGVFWDEIYRPDPSPLPGNPVQDGFLACPADQWTCFDIPSSWRDYRLWRLREVRGTGMWLRHVQFGRQPNEVPASRFNRDQYQQQADKRATYGRQVLNYWLDRKNTQPELVVWSASEYGFDQMAVWRYRHVHDPGPVSGTLEIPQRWEMAVLCGLAEHVFLELPAASVDAKRYPILQAHAEKHLRQAEGGENDASPFNIMPRIGVYT